MSTFSSVARKSGLGLKPKAVPRRSGPRQARKTIVAATLTPESLPQSPDVRSNSPVPPTSESALPRNLGPKSFEQEPNPALTPPATAQEVVDPLLQIAPVGDVSVSDLDTSGSVERNDSQGNDSEVPEVLAAKSSLGRGNKRRVDGIAVSEDNNGVTPPQTQASDNARSKRRKVAPQAGAPYVLSQGTSTSRAQTETNAARRSQSMADDRARASTEDLLIQATASFGSVSRIAGNIEDRTRNLRPRTGRTSATTRSVDTESEGEELRRRRTQKSSRSSAIENLADAIVHDAGGRGRKRKRRDATPEDAEDHEIDIGTVSMKDLTKDTGLGKRSETGKELDKNWAEISRRWREGPEENRRKAEAKTQDYKNARKQRDKATGAVPGDREEDILANSSIIQLHPVMEIVNGVITVQQDSRQVDFQSNLPEAVEKGGEVAREYRKVDNYVNSNRVGKNAGLRTQKRWDDSSDELFYKGLRMFGTDFEMIASLFPTRGRAEIKAKYTREERENWDKVQKNIKNREAWTTSEVAEMMGRQDPWETPEELAAELEREEQRMREEARQKDIEEGLIANPDAADQPIQSIETQDVGGEDAEVPELDERRRRIEALAEAAVSDAVRPPSTRTPVQRKRGPRRTRDATVKTVKGKKGKQTLAGVEEVIGNVREVER